MKEKLPGREIELWFQDEARYGQKGNLTAIWAKRGGPRPRVVRQTRYLNVWLFGAACPKTGQAHGLILPKANTTAMQIWLNSFSASLGEGKAAMLVMDQAGWHKSSEITWPENVVPCYLPAYSPELNPMENLWAYLKGMYLSNCVYEDHEALLEAGSKAWLQATPEIIKSVCHKSWIDTVI